jgi:hypothetical protein
VKSKNNMINILRELCRNKKGRIEGVSMADMLQLIWLEKMTCRLLVKSSGKRGTLNISDGELKYAKTANKEGKEAAMDILTWEEVTIELDHKSDPASHSFKASTEEMLLDNIRRLEEKNTLANSLLNDDRQKKEWNDKVGMDLPKLQKSIDILKVSLGEALLAIDFWGNADLRSIAGWNFQPEATVVFGQIIHMTKQALQDSGFPGLGKYCIIDLAEGKVIIFIPIGDYAWGLFLDIKKVQLGFVLNVVLPKAITFLQDPIN